MNADVLVIYYVFIATGMLCVYEDITNPSQDDVNLPNNDLLLWVDVCINTAELSLSSYM
jgi:hypothetical protein